MTNRNRSHYTLAVVLVAAVMLIAGGAAIASNTGFKMNKTVAPPSPAGGLNGNYWTSLPYHNPYQNGRDFCQKTGLTTSGFSQHTLFRQGTDGVPVGTFACGSTGAAGMTLPKGEGIRIISPAGSAVQSIMIVGSHDGGKSMTVPTFVNPNIGRLWLSIPYHSTALKIRDICIHAGLQMTGFNQGTVFYIQPEAPTGSPNGPVACGSTQAASTDIVLGKAYRLTNPNAAVNFIPAHF